MSEENVEIVRKFYDAYIRGDREGVGRRLDTDIESTPLLGPLLGVRTLRGRDQVVEFLFEVENVIEGWRVDQDEIVDLGDDRVLALETRHGRPKGTYADVTQEAGTIFELRNELIVSAQSYPSHREALAAAGLEE